MKLSIYLADQNPHRDRSLGITRVTELLLGELDRRDGITLETVVSRSSYRFPGAAREIRLPFRTDHAPGRLLGDHLHTLWSPRDAEIAFFPKGFLPAWNRRGVPRVGLVHDTILLWYGRHRPDARSPMALRYWIGQLRSSLRRFDRVLTVSEAARRQIESACAGFGIPVPLISVVGSATAWESESAVRGNGDYLLHLASSAPHKQTAWLLDAWTALQHRGVALPRLHLIGSLPTTCRDAVDGKTITQQGRVDESELKRQIAQARALILPSAIEGFGLPALESYCLGTPVAFAQRAEALAEILTGEAAIGGFADDPDSLAAAVQAVLAMPWETVAAIGGRLRERFSTKRCVDRIVRVLEEMMAAR